MINKAEIINNSLSGAEFWQSELPDFSHNFGKNGWSNKPINCPFNEHEKKGGFSVHENGGYHCFKCGVGGGGIIDFFMELNSSDFLTACDSIARDFNIVFPQQTNTKAITIGAVGNQLSVSKIKRLHELLLTIQVINDTAFFSADDAVFSASVFSETIELIGRIYGQPRGKNKNQFKKYLLLFIERLHSMIYSRVLAENYSFKMRCEIINEQETRLARYIAFCLSI